MRCRPSWAPPSGARGERGPPSCCSRSRCWPCSAGRGVQWSGDRGSSCRAAAVSLGLLRTVGLVAHATEGDLGGVGAIADLVHLIGVATWMGGLVFLVAVVLPRRRVAELRRVVPAFSRLAFVATIGIVVAGTVMAWDLAGSFGSLGNTEWGRLLLLKVALFAVVLTAAQLSKRWVYDRLGVAVALRGHAALLRPLVVSVAAETLLAAAVLGVAAALVTTSPGT